LIITVSLSGIVDHDLWTPDEPREAAIALSMSQSGNIVIPELAGQPFVEKPPLFYIIASLFLRAFGQFIGNTAALRLVSACFGLGTLLFTYLLGKIYFSRKKALIATAILATMFGFVHVTHWLLVDNALMFFITASVWALAKAYPDPSESRNNCPAFLPLAGILAACAFLTKGVIGPLIIAFAWAGLFTPWIKKFGWREILSSRSVLFHFLGIIAVCLISAIWITAFAIKGGPELFHEWWWTNHFGRFTGQATHLGHISPWYYYFGALPIYILPWLAPFIIALAVLLKKLSRAEPIPAGGAMLITWIAGTFALLSLSATKREIYLNVLLPACALLCL
ncbi:MAG: glycosyltransferase family 39 protein, partial [Candidatus Komeilibacteria bacterium]|nr:glycosyltransferase family 39 protein [Candidatus Komeilibacteria bacterium]